MIAGFFNRVRADLTFLQKAADGKFKHDENLDKKIGLVFARFLAIVLMGTTVVVAFDILKNAAKKSLGGVALNIAMLVASYILARDGFIIAKNSTNHSFTRLGAQNLFGKNLLFQGTVFEPLWKIIYKATSR